MTRSRLAALSLAVALAAPAAALTGTTRAGQPAHARSTIALRFAPSVAPRHRALLRRAFKTEAIHLALQLGRMGVEKPYDAVLVAYYANDKARSLGGRSAFVNLAAFKDRHSTKEVGRVAAFVHRRTGEFSFNVGIPGRERVPAPGRVVRRR